MVIHDMRNPTNSIEYGVREVLETIRKLKKGQQGKVKLIKREINQKLEAHILATFGSILRYLGLSKENYDGN